MARTAVFLFVLPRLYVRGRIGLIDLSSMAMPAIGGAQAGGLAVLFVTARTTDTRPRRSYRGEKVQNEQCNGYPTLAR